MSLEAGHIFDSVDFNVLSQQFHLVFSRLTNVDHAYHACLDSLDAYLHRFDGMGHPHFDLHTRARRLAKMGRTRRGLLTVRRCWRLVEQTHQQLETFPYASPLDFDAMNQLAEQASMSFLVLTGWIRGELGYLLRFA